MKREESISVSKKVKCEEGRRYSIRVKNSTRITENAKEMETERDNIYNVNKEACLR